MLNTLTLTSANSFDIGKSVPEGRKDEGKKMQARKCRQKNAGKTDAGISKISLTVPGSDVLRALVKLLSTVRQEIDPRADSTLGPFKVRVVKM